MHRKKKLVVIAASAGGIGAYQQLFRGLPRYFPAPIVCVQHITPDPQTRVATFFDRDSRMTVQHVEDRVPLRPGHAYINKPDEHLIIDGRDVAVSRVTTEKHIPSADLLFRTAAEHFGAGVVAVTMTGQMEDGASGLLAVYEAGGRAIVQEPDDAAYPSMPQNAILRDHPEFIVPLERIPEILMEVTQDSGWEPVV